MSSTSEVQPHEVGSGSSGEGASEADASCLTDDCGQAEQVSSLRRGFLDAAVRSEELVFVWGRTQDQQRHGEVAICSLLKVLVL